MFIIQGNSIHFLHAVALTTHLSVLCSIASLRIFFNKVENWKTFITICAAVLLCVEIIMCFWWR